MPESSWEQLPAPLERAIEREQAKGRPVYASWKAGDGVEYWSDCDTMTVAQFEQATEFESRKMRKAFKRFMLTGSLRTAKTFAECYSRVHYYRRRYSELVGVPFDDSDLPIRELPADANPKTLDS